MSGLHAFVLFACSEKLWLKIMFANLLLKKQCIRIRSEHASSESNGGRLEYKFLLLKHLGTNMCGGIDPIPLRLDLGQEAWPITRRVQGLTRQPGVSRKEARCGDQTGF